MTPAVLIAEPAHVADVRGWLEDQKFAIRELFNECGAISCGAFLLVTRDPETGARLELPKTKIALLSDYQGDLEMFGSALRHWIATCEAIASVIAAEAAHIKVRSRKADAAQPVVCLSFEHRGRRPKMFVAPIGEAPKRMLVGDFVEIESTLTTGPLQNLFPKMH